MSSNVIDNNEEQDHDIMERAKREYFQLNPEAKPFENLIQFFSNGTTTSIDDSKLPPDIAAIIRKRDGKNPL